VQGPTLKQALGRLQECLVRDAQTKAVAGTPPTLPQRRPRTASMAEHQKPSCFAQKAFDTTIPMLRGGEAAPGAWRTGPLPSLCERKVGMSSCRCGSGDSLNHLWAGATGRLGRTRLKPPCAARPRRPPAGAHGACRPHTPPTCARAPPWR
jgi:hypothetical protein